MPATICRSSPPTSIFSTSRRSAFGWFSAATIVATRRSSCWKSASVAIALSFQFRHLRERLRLESIPDQPVVVFGELAELAVANPRQRFFLLPSQALVKHRFLFGAITLAGGEERARRRPRDRRDQTE